MPARRLGAHWLQAQPRHLLPFFSVDYIFLYQFVFYLAIWAYAILRVTVFHHALLSPLFLVAPPAALVGFLITRKWGMILCAAGDAAMAWGTYYEAWFHRHDFPFLVLCCAVLATCMLMRFIRDVLVVLTPYKGPENG